MKFIALGPRGSNHEFVTRHYLEFHGLAERATLDLVNDFEEGARRVLAHQADFMVQCAVHPATMATVAKYLQGLYVVDTFISPSQDLAILQRVDAPAPRTLAVMLPTLCYTDPARWENLTFVDTVAQVSQGLLDGRYEAGLGYASTAEQNPETLRIAEFIGTVDDAWIVYGRTRVSDNRLLAWRDSPAAVLYRSAE
ncbi:MAG: hypothetical protein JSS56_02185 [Proteobacteria bacterium]|nr:hypothetical protein [Pseudomonadota bacterium]